MAFAGVSKGLSFVLCMIRNLKIMCSKAVECLQKLKGSSPFFSFSFFEEREYQRSSTDNLNEWTCCNTFLGHRGSFMSCMAYAWNISPCGGECVCECVCVRCPSSQEQMSVKWSTYKPAACHSQFHVGQVPHVTLESRNASGRDRFTTSFDQHVKI